MRVLSKYAFALELLLLSVVMPLGSVSFAKSIKIEGGSLQGTTEDGLRVYRGIPYAAPPVGDLRWRAPQPPPKWKGVRAALYADERGNRESPSAKRGLSVPQCLDTRQGCFGQIAGSGVDSWWGLHCRRTRREALSRRVVGQERCSLRFGCISPRRIRFSGASRTQCGEPSPRIRQLRHS